MRIAVGRGPGAFTGVRLAISAAQGIALALDIPVVPVSSLAALAMQAPDNGADVLAVIDARMGEVYAACFGAVDERRRSGRRRNRRSRRRAATAAADCART